MSVIKAGGVLYAPFRLPLSDVYVAAIIGVRGSAGLTVRPVDKGGQVCALVDAHFLDGFLEEETKNWAPFSHDATSQSSFFFFFFFFAL